MDGSESGKSFQGRQLQRQLTKVRSNSSGNSPNDVHGPKASSPSSDEENSSETGPADVEEAKQELAKSEGDTEEGAGSNEAENQEDEDEQVENEAAISSSPGTKNGIRLLDVASLSEEGSQGHANEDRLLVASNERFHLLAVMDGHGGSWAGDFLVDELFDALDAVYDDGFDHAKVSKAMEELDRSFCAQATRKSDFSGACLLAVILYVDPNTGSPQKLVLNIGDCRAIVRETREKIAGVERGKAQHAVRDGATTFALSDDHCASNPNERMRALRSGAYIQNKRIAGVLEPFRTIGDIDVKGPDMKNWVIATPEIRESELLVGRSILVIATDGVWSVLNNNRAMALVTKELSANGPKSFAEPAARAIIHEAREFGSCDDISVIVVSV